MGLHTDDSENRSYTFVIYLTPDWKPDYGGTLVVVAKDGVEHRIEAEYNSLACFDASAGHYVATINDAAGERARLTIGGWFLNPK
jgi:Rps23 Pro-64 3,4-dihydroxylase Tpa1-like proline 4-hydroxylase